MNDKWKRFCERTEKLYNEREEKVQEVFELIFDKLFDYDSFEEEIDSHRVLHIGSTDRVIPDIIIRDSSENKDLFIVELKQLNLRFDKKYAEQLVSYMKLLSLSIGILICDAIYICILDNGEPKYRKIEVSADNPEGEKFIELFSKGSFSGENVKKFVLEKKQLQAEVCKIVEELDRLALEDVVKLYLADCYTEPAIDVALKEYDFIIRKKETPPPQPPRGKEKIQDWVKRIFGYLARNNILNLEEIHRLHDLEYSKKTFGIRYAMFVDRQKDTIFTGGHARYWQKPIGRYYVCSQWWLDQDREYETNIRWWLNKVLPNYKELGLDRHTIATKL